MKTFAVLLFKDLRAVRGWIAATAVLIVVLLLCPQRGALGENQLGYPDLASWLSLACPLVLIFMLRSLLLTDLANGDQRFIATRPVRGEWVLASKVVALLLGGVIPLSLAMAVRLWTAGLQVTATEGLMVAWADAWLFMSLLGLFLLWQGEPGQAWWWALPHLILGVIVLVVARLALVPAAYHMPWDPYVALAVTLGFPFWTVLLGRYGKWRQWVRLVAAVVVWVGAAWLTDFWRHGNSPTEPPAPEVTGLHFKGAAVSSSWWGYRYVVVYLTARMDGLAPGTWAEPTQCEGTYQADKDGPQQSFRSDLRRSLQQRMTSEAAVLALPNLGPSSLQTKDVEFNAELGIVRLLPTRFKAQADPSQEEWDTTAARVQGVCHMDLYRAELVAIVPLRAGAEWQGRHERFAIAKVENPNNSTLIIECTSDHFGAVQLPLQWTMGGGLLGGNEYACFGIDQANHLVHPWDASGSFSTSTLLQRRGYHFSSADVRRNWFGWVGPDGSTAINQNGTISIVPSGSGGVKRALNSDGTVSVVPADHVELAVYRRVKVGTAAIPFDLVNQRGFALIRH